MKVHTSSKMNKSKLIARIRSQVLISQSRHRNNITLQQTPRRFFSNTNNKTNTTDYFQIMGLHQSFHVSHDELKQLYRNHMKLLHPDKHTLKSIPEQESTAKLASEITRGYEVLKDDYERSLHLLELNGNPMEDDVSGTILGSEFLMDIMEIREGIDGTEDEGMLRDFMGDNQGRIDETCEELGVAFGKKDLDEAKRLAAKLQYWNRIRETILEKM